MFKVFIRQLGEAEVWVDLHGVEVSEAFDQGGHLGELLTEGVRHIVGGISGDDQHRLSGFGQLDCQTAAAARLKKLHQHQDHVIYLS